MKSIEFLLKAILQDLSYEVIPFLSIRFEIPKNKLVLMPTFTNELRAFIN